MPDPSDPDYLALDVTNSILGGSFASRITSNIREDKGYTYSPYSSLTSNYKTGIWYEYFSGEERNVTDVATSIILQPGEFRIYSSEKLDDPREGADTRCR